MPGRLSMVALVQSRRHRSLNGTATNSPPGSRRIATGVEASANSAVSFSTETAHPAEAFRGRKSASPLIKR